MTEYHTRISDCIDRITEDLNATLHAKADGYGASWKVSADIFRALYPNGVPVHAYEEALVLVRICDKMQRIANVHAQGRTAWQSKRKSDDDDFRDIAGYGAVGLIVRWHMSQEQEREQDLTPTTNVHPLHDAYGVQP